MRGWDDYQWFWIDDLCFGEEVQVFQYMTLDPSDLPSGFTQSDITITVTRMNGAPVDGTEDIHRVVVEVRYGDGSRSVTLEGYRSNR